MNVIAVALSERVVCGGLRATYLMMLCDATPHKTMPSNVSYSVRPAMSRQTFAMPSHGKSCHAMQSHWFSYHTTWHDTSSFNLPIGFRLVVFEWGPVLPVTCTECFHQKYMFCLNPFASGLASRLGCIWGHLKSVPEALPEGIG